MRIFKSIAQFISNNTIWVLILVYVYIRSLYWDCLPIWDGMLHYSNLIDAIQSPFNILNYSQDAHNCEGFMLLMALPYKLYNGSYYAFNIWVTIFSLLSIVGFYELLLFFLKERISKHEIVMITALFAFHPTVLGSMIHFTIDMGVLTFFILYWVMLLKEKRLATGIFALLLLFSKETAMLLLPLPFLFGLFLQPTPRRVSWLKEFSKYFYTKSNSGHVVLVPLPVLFRSLFKPSPERILWFKRHFLILLIPYLLLGLFILYKVFIGHQPALSYVLDNDVAVLDYFGSDGKFINYLGMIFILNFNWILTLLWLILFIMLLIRWRLINDLFQKRLSKNLTLLVLGVLFVLTLAVSWSTPRYVMLMVPLMLLAIAQLSAILISSRYIRISALLILLVLFFIEDERTIDPVSKFFFGKTISFGHHELINTKNRTNEDSYEKTRDQLVYNLEYLKIRQLLNVIYSDIRPTSETYFIFKASTLDRTIYPLDSNYKMALQGNNLITPKIVAVYNTYYLPALPGETYLVDLPNADNTDLIEVLNKYYSYKTVKVYERDGYQINVIHYKK